MSKLTLYAFIFYYSLGMALSSSTLAQRKLLNEHTVKLQNSDYQLIKLIRQIEASGEFSFVYSEKELKNRKVTLRSGNWNMKSLLSEISTQAKVSIRRVNESIAITPAITNEFPQVSEEIVQERVISGQITDDMGEPLPGATVQEKGTTNGTITDIDGRFQLSVGDDAVLVVSFVGFQTQEITIGARSVIDVQLATDFTSLEEVVVVGYGTQRREDITSSVASVSSEDFVAGSTRDVGQLIQGKVAGLTIANPSGDPTAGTSIRLRGNTTLVGADASPLVIIDGVPGALNTVAPEDIESIDVLKDGSAAAIYGVRGNNGVILITTKKADGNTNRVNYSSSISLQQIARRAELLTAADYREQIANGERDASFDLGGDTDWLEEITRNPVSQIHNLTFSGGSPKTNYIANVNYRGLEGIMLKSNNKTLTGRLEINHKMFNDKIAVNAGLLNWYNRLATTADGGSFNSDAYQQSLRFNPTAPVYDETGAFSQNIGYFNYTNPVSLLKEADGRNVSQNTRFYGSITAYLTDHLQIKALGSINNYNQDRGYYETTNHISTLRSGRNGYASTGGVEAVEHVLDVTALYENSFGKHDFSFLAGYSYQDLDRSEHWMQNWDFPTDRFSYHQIQLGQALQEGLANMGSDRYKTNLIGVLGRINYSYDDKYLFMASVRREGASQLWGAEKPFGTFPALSIGWKLSNESFMQSISQINMLKLRYGYGVTGNRPGNLTLGVPIISYTGNFYYGGEWIQTLSPTQNANPYLKWEEKHESNFGLEFEAFDCLSGSVDYYVRKTKDLLYNYPVPVPPNLVNYITTNAASINNKGLEISLTFDVIRTADLNWSSTVLFSKNTSELVSLGNDVYQTDGDSVLWNGGGLGEPLLNYSTHIIEKGQPIGNFYGLKVVDITDDGKWVYENREGDHVTVAEDEFGKSPEDYQVLGNGLPGYYVGWNNSVSYKSFDFSVTMRGAFDYQILNATRVFYENPTIKEYNRLASSKDLVFDKAALTEDLEFNSYYIENGDFWKIDNITLGYTLPKITEHIKSLRIYASTLNTFVFTKYSGIDPEVGQGGLSPGIDNRFKYPTTRTYTLGINVSF